MLEELLALGHAGAEYDAWLINIGEGEQFGERRMSRSIRTRRSRRWWITASRSRCACSSPVRSSIYLAEKFGAFLPTERAARAETLTWLFWQMGRRAYLGGGFGHFYAYAPEQVEYPIDRYAMEVKRQLDVLDRRLAESEYLARQRRTPSPTWRCGPGTARW